MSAYRILISAILFLISVLFFYALNSALDLISELHDVISFSITLLVLISFHDTMRNLLQRIVAKRYFQRVTKAQETLLFLNSELNRVLRYKEVNRILFNSFKQLFEHIPYAFYIYENGKFILQDEQLITDQEILVRDIDSSEISWEDAGTLQFSIKETALPKSVIKKMRQAGLTEVVPFQGRLQLFAFLLINYKDIPFRNDKQARQLFNKIQNKAGYVLENTGLFVDLEQKSKETKNLIQISNQILSSFDVKQTLNLILSTLKSVTSYDAAAVYLLDKTGKRLLHTSSVGYDKELMDKLHLKVGQGSCGWVAESKKIAVEDDVRTSKHYYLLREATRSQVSIPLIRENEVIGVLCLESDRLSFFNHSVVENLRLFAHLATIAIYNTSQLETLVAKRALENDLIDAGIVQKKLLVHQFPNLANFKMTATNIPSKFMSGDLYDVIRFSENVIGLAIGDVSGKGAPASLMMALLLAGLRSQKKSFLNSCDVVYRLNNLVAETTIEGKYATFFYGIFVLDQQRFIYTNAGHNPPLFIKENGEVIRLTEGGIVMGYLPNWNYNQQDFPWKSGDLLVAYTDGVTEAMNAGQEEFGEQRLIDIILQNRHETVFSIRQKIISAISEFSGTEAHDDDITLVVCKNE